MRKLFEGTSRTIGWLSRGPTGIIYIGDAAHVIEEPLGAMPWGEFLNKYHRVADNGPAHPVEDDKAILVDVDQRKGPFPVIAQVHDGQIKSLMIDFDP